MAYVAADNIVQRLREVLQDGAGTLRTIAAARFQGDLPPGLTPEEQRRRGLYEQKPVEIELTGMRPHPQRLSRAGSVQIWTVDATVRVVRTIATPEQLDDSLRDDVRALAIEDASAISDVLEWPGNLGTTAAGGETGIKGCDYVRSSARVNGRAGGAMDITTDHVFEIVAVTTNESHIMTEGFAPLLTEGGAYLILEQ